MDNTKVGVMKKALLGVLLSSTLVLAACQMTEEEPMDPVEETGTETSEDSKAEDTETEDTEVEDTLTDDDDHELMYSEMLAQAQLLVESNQYEEAAGTLTLLLESDLNNYPDIKEQAEALNAEITENQTGIQLISGGTDIEASIFKEERQSEIIAQLYQDETGQAIEDATDEQLHIWIEQDEEDSQIEESDMTKEEAEDYAFEQLLERVDLENDAYFFFVNQEDAEWVQMEARESVDQDGVAWSNLIGMYRYNIQTDELLQLDSATGEYNSVE